MTGKDLAGVYEFSFMAINRNLNDLAHEDSVHIPDPGGNCINWVLGHIISARGMVLLLTGGGTPVFSEAEAAVRRPISNAKIEGTMNKVTNVDISSPPMTARPRGACIALPRSRANAIGAMPTDMAQAVIKMGRRRCSAPARAASGTSLPSCHSFAMNVTNMTELDTETPTHMIAPMKDSVVKVVRVTQSATTTPARTAGTDATAVKASRGAWK